MKAIIYKERLHHRVYQKKGNDELETFSKVDTKKTFFMGFMVFQKQTANGVTIIRFLQIFTVKIVNPEMIETAASTPTMETLVRRTVYSKTVLRIPVSAIVSTQTFENLKKVE